MALLLFLGFTLDRVEGKKVKKKNVRCVSAWRFIKFVYCVLSKEPAVWSIAPTPQDASCLKTRGAANVLSAFMLTSVTEVGSPVFSFISMHFIISFVKEKLNAPQNYAELG